MAINPGKLNSLLNHLAEIKRIYFEELDHIVENSRWLTTLVIAEIGGIAAYRNLLDKGSLSIFFAITILILALTIVCFMTSVLLSRKAKKDISSETNKSINEVKKINDDGNIPPNDGDNKIDIIRVNLNETISNQPKYSRFWEAIGIFLFLVGSFFAVIKMFFLEICQSFGL